jgi:hypothetical protein
MATWCCTLTVKHTMHHGHEVLKKCSISDSLADSEDFCTKGSPSFDTDSNNNECDSSDVSRFCNQ